MTTASRIGSTIFAAAIVHMITMGCGNASEAGPAPATRPDPGPAAPDPARDPVRPEACLGVTDRGIWSDLDDKVQLELPSVAADRVTAVVDLGHNLLVVSIDGFPRKGYPLTGTATLPIGSHQLALRPGDRAELAGVLTERGITDGPPRGAHDVDHDGIPDPLDVLIGAKKTVLNADDYTEGYVEMKYPMGDVPRTIGVCTDVIVRAVRNAGIDIQQALHDDIRAAPRAYPMIKGKGNASIDQRRVGTLLPYFRRHWEAHTPKLDDAADPLRPGDVIFMDTFPSRSGPDHIGILSDRLDDQGLPLVINNWTNGTTTAEMDLLTFVPVLQRFRLPP